MIQLWTWLKVSEVAQSCLTLWDPIDCSLPGSSIHGIFQARVLEWVAISFSGGSSWPRNRTWVSRTVGRYFNVWATRVMLLSFMKREKWGTRQFRHWQNCHCELRGHLPRCQGTVPWFHRPEQFPRAPGMELLLWQEGQRYLPSWSWKQSNKPKTISLESQNLVKFF